MKAEYSSIATRKKADPNSPKSFSISNESSSDSSGIIVIISPEPYGSFLDQEMYTMTIPTAIGQSSALSGGVGEKSWEIQSQSVTDCTKTEP